MKKLTLALALLLTLAITACGNTDPATGTGEPTQPSDSGGITQSQPQADTTTAATTAAQDSQKEQMIFHAANTSEYGTFGVLVYVSPLSPTEISYVIREYIDAPWNEMFLQYDSTAGIYSENMSVSVHRVNMRDADGTPLIADGTIKMTVSGGVTMTYQAILGSGEPGDVWVLSRITEAEVERMNRDSM